DDRRLEQHDAFAAADDDRVRRAEVNRELTPPRAQERHLPLVTASTPTGCSVVGAPRWCGVRAVDPLRLFDELRRVVGSRYAPAIAPADEVPRLHLALALDRDPAPRLALELVGEQLVRRTGDLDPPGRSVGLHTARRVHGVAPEVVQEALAADHAGDD